MYKFSDSDRFLLCIPLGGLNDTLVQIEKCWEYAKKYNRILLIETTRGTVIDSNYFSENFDEFFSFKDAYKDKVRVIYNSDYINNNMLELLDSLDCHPTHMQGSLRFYNKWKSRLHEVDFSKDYIERLLIHYTWGGGEETQNFLNKVTLSDRFRKRIIPTLNTLPKDYMAIHIRHTDYQSNFQRFFEKIKKKVKKENLLICSDNPIVIDYAKEYFNESKIFTITTVPCFRIERNLHTTDYETRVDDAFIDLFALAKSKKLFFTKVRPKRLTKKNIYNQFFSKVYNESLFTIRYRRITLVNIFKGLRFILYSLHITFKKLFWAKITNKHVHFTHTSGFSKLATYLHKNPHVIDNLLGVETSFWNDKEEHDYRSIQKD